MSSAIKAALVATFLVLVSVPSAAQAKTLTVDEVLTLLKAGVPSTDVLALLERRGGPTGVVEGDLDAARSAGAKDPLISHLGDRLKSLVKLRALAAAYDVFENRKWGVSLLHPKGWVLSPLQQSEDSWFLSIQREAAPASAWFKTARLFVWIQKGTSLPARAQPEIARKMVAVISRRLRAAGMEPGDPRTSLAMLGRQAAPEYQLRATMPHQRFKGTLTLRTRVLADGTVVCAGFACSDGELPTTRPLFEELARSLSL
ncbi:MAG: hypothetical protein CMJ83_14440 [Planctomycetes bacterium]|nr:hypothetical protein [Planctomycetota bacterium]